MESNRRHTPKQDRSAKYAGTERFIGSNQRVDSLEVYYGRIAKFPLLNAEQETLVIQAYSWEETAEIEANEDLLSQLDPQQRKITTLLIKRDNAGKKANTEEEIANNLKIKTSDLQRIKDDIVAKLKESCSERQLEEQRGRNRLMDPLDIIFQAKREEMLHQEDSAINQLRGANSEFRQSINRAVAEEEKKIPSKRDPKLKEKFDFALSESGSVRDLMINCNLRFVIALASKSDTLTLDDKIQAGWFGLKRAVEKFDHTKGFKFSTYAIGWIRQSIQKAIIDEDRTIRLTSEVEELVTKANKLRSEILGEEGRELQQAELASRLASGGARKPMADTAANIVLSGFLHVDSLNREISGRADNGEMEQEDFTADPNARTEGDGLYLIEKGEIAEVISSAAVSDREADILILRNVDGLTFEEIGKIYGVTRERVRQLELRARAKLQSNPKIQSIWDSFHA